MKFKSNIKDSYPEMYILLLCTVKFVLRMGYLRILNTHDKFYVPEDIMCEISFMCYILNMSLDGSVSNSKFQDLFSFKE